MMKNVLTAAAVSASLLAVLTAAPVAQAGFDRAVAKRSHAVIRVLAHKRKAHKHHAKRHHKYDRHITYGYPNNCPQLKRRAHLTGNAYWRYAAHRCETDRYISH